MLAGTREEMHKMLMDGRALGVVMVKNSDDRAVADALVKAGYIDVSLKNTTGFVYRFRPLAYDYCRVYDVGCC